MSKLKIPMNVQMVDVNELAGYLEALSEETRNGLKEVASSIPTESNLVINKGDLNMIRALDDSIKALRQKEFSLENPMDEKKLHMILRDVQKAVERIRIPDTVTIENIPQAAAPVIKVELKKEFEQLSKDLKKFFSETLMQSEITNLDQIPVALAKTQQASASSKTAPIIYNKVLTVASTWYSQALSDPTRAFALQLEEAEAMDIHFGDDTKYWTVKAGTNYAVEGSVGTVYARSTGTGNTLQITELH